MTNKVKTRFAPSPTGYMHVGSLRTALYNYLFAKQNNGQFILRIEDTDQKREMEGALENLLKILDWAGLKYDEGPDIGENGPYIQSERTEVYREYAEKLLEAGHAYYCFCSSERLTEMREEQIAKKLSPMYDKQCLKMDKDEVDAMLKAGKPAVVRQKIPYEGRVEFGDIIRGKISVDPKTLDDQILLKSDNFPTYHLANVVDDHLMGITHVIRGEEWLPSTPKHVLLYSAFEWELPQFAHVPLLLNPDRSKLSKRQGHVAVEDYIKEGHLREAVINFIALLGWHPKDNQEIFSLDELIREFSLERVQKGGAIFDFEKLKWFSWQWRKKKFEEAGSDDEKLKLLEEFCGHLIPAAFRQDEKLLERALFTISEKIFREPSEILEHISFYFRDHEKIPEELFVNEKMKVDLEISREALEKSLPILEKISNWSQENLQNELKKLIERMGVKNGQVLWPLRAALTGEKFSPGTFEVLWAFGKEESIKRIQKTLESF